MYITADEKGVRSMNHSEISSFIWGTADLLRSSFKQHEYGDIILPFTVMRRLDVVLEPTKQAVLEAAHDRERQDDVAVLVLFKA